MGGGYIKMSWLPVILIALPGLPAFASLIKTVILFVKDFYEAFIIEFKIAYKTEAMRERDTNYPD